ncbi:hypothetical protein OAQ99_07125 [Candidatus Kapabacteria bacterium]|nr:hypothetical protein [Candidatus Kapabacteria bacterium]
MADLSNIKLTSNIGDVSHGNSGNQYQAQQPQKKEQTPSKLRVGEIVRGTISDRINQELAYVRIPTGTFKAVISSNLKKDDSLLFKVVETSPNLVLKVHEVNTLIRGEVSSIDNLLRVLDLPKIPLYLELIDKMRRTRKSILRDDALEIYKLVSKGEKEFLSVTTISSLLNQMNEMQIAKLPLSINLIKKLIPLFVEENIISKYLNNLVDGTKELTGNLKTEIEDYLVDVKKNNYKKNNLFLLSISSEDSTSSFFELLIKISEDDYSQKLKKAAAGLRDLIAAMSLWNIISFSGKSPFHYIIPYYYNGAYYVIRIIKQTMNKAGNSPVSFSFSMPTENIGEVRAKILSFQNQLKIYLEAESEKIVDTIEKFRANLESAVSQKGFKLESLKIGLEDIASELSEISSSKSGDHFTVVV